MIYAKEIMSKILAYVIVSANNAKKRLPCTNLLAIIRLLLFIFIAINFDYYVIKQCICIYMLHM